MKRITVMLLVFALLFALGACSADADYGEARISCAAQAQKADFSARFRLNMTFEQGTYTLLFSQGEYTARRGEDGVYVRVKASQNYLGGPSALDTEYKDGVYGATGEEMTESEFFGQLLFLQPFVPDEKYINSVKEVSTGSGKGYTFELRDATDLLFPFLGESIYSVAMLDKPRRDLTDIRSAYLTLIPDPSGGIAGMTLNFRLVLADTPPYVPGGADRQEDYTFEIAVEYTASFE
ncbi:MAG: hypothetical protein IJL41_03575 [Clostridia bacterium]|nr:hypothetical protein [Clostridia bacterium]